MFVVYFQHFRGQHPDSRCTLPDPRCTVAEDGKAHSQSPSSLGQPSLTTTSIITGGQEVMQTMMMMTVMLNPFHGTRMTGCLSR